VIVAIRADPGRRDVGRCRNRSKAVLSSFDLVTFGLPGESASTAMARCRSREFCFRAFGNLTLRAHLPEPTSTFTAGDLPAVVLDGGRVHNRDVSLARDDLHAGHGHEHASELSETQIRVRALESVLVENGYVDPAALDCWATGWLVTAGEFGDTSGTPHCNRSGCRRPALSSSTRRPQASAQAVRTRSAPRSRPRTTRTRRRHPLRASPTPLSASNESDTGPQPTRAESHRA